MSVNLRNGVSESKLSCKEGMSEGISKYEGYSNKKENGSRTSNIIEAIGWTMTNRDKVMLRQPDYSQFESLSERG